MRTVFSRTARFFLSCPILPIRLTKTIRVAKMSVSVILLNE